VKRDARGLIVKLTLCTLAGAVVTWGVAGGCALWVPVRVQSARGAALDGFLTAPPSWSERSETDLLQLTTTDARGIGLRHGVCGRLLLHGGDRLGDIRLMWRLEAGWPVPAVMGEGRREMTTVTSRGALAIPPWLRPRPLPTSRPHLPARILPVGFTLNTLLAAGVLLGVVEGFAFARRRVRRAKGRCPSCGYDRGGLAGDAACPECGAAV
jgi:hypothetical protein